MLRRDFIATLGAFTTISAFGQTVSGTETLPPTIAQQLASYAHNLRYEDLDPATIEAVKGHLIDAIGCAVAAWEEKPVQITRQVALNDAPANLSHYGDGDAIFHILISSGNHYFSIVKGRPDPRCSLAFELICRNTNGRLFYLPIPTAIHAASALNNDAIAEMRATIHSLCSLADRCASMKRRCNSKSVARGRLPDEL